MRNLAKKVSETSCENENDKAFCNDVATNVRRPLCYGQRLPSVLDVQFRYSANLALRTEVTNSELHRVIIIRIYRKPRGWDKILDT